MDKYLEKRLEQIKKSMYKKVKELNKKTPIEDLMDGNRLAESKEDDDDIKTGSVMSKEECDCKDQDDCECDEVKKAEKIIDNMVKNFKAVSEKYLAKARSEEGMRPEHKRAMRQVRNEGFKPKTKDKREVKGNYPKEYRPKEQKDLKAKLQNKQDKKIKYPSKDNLKYPKTSAKPKKERETVKIRGFEEEQMAASEGVNMTSEDKSDKGGLTQKGRDKYNKATGGNLKAPVSAKQAKKSPKKASRRKSFCARMSGNKGKLYEYKDTDRDGDKEKVPTRKKKALDRWDC